MHARISDGKVIQIADVRSMFPDVSFPTSGPDEKMCAFLGVLPVIDSLATSPTETLESIEPEIVGNQVHVVRVRAMSVDEIQSIEQDRAALQQAIVREDRARRLAVTDWTQLADSPLSAEQKQAWSEYRQALREVPQQAGFPFDIIWPTQP